MIHPAIIAQTYIVNNELEKITEITRDKTFNLYLKEGQFRKWKPNISTMAFNALFRGILFLLLLCVAVNFMKANELMNHHELHMAAKESIGNIAVGAMKSIDTEPLEHEKMFTDTLKDCMPSIGQDGNKKKKKKECMTFVPEGSKERIAILTPPGKMNASLLKFIRIVLTRGKKGNDGEFAAAQVEVIPTTNMVSIHLFHSFAAFMLVTVRQGAFPGQNEWLA